jgi:hypothetical protein
MLLPVPAAVMWAGATYQIARGPYWLGTNYDPSYAYLLNSVRLAQLQTPQHVDHPGTTVHALGALVLPVVHRSLGITEELEDDVLRYPEFYLRILTGCFLCLYTALLYLCGSLALDVLGSVPLAWLVQATPFLSLNGFLELSDVKPEPLLLSVAAAVTAVLLWSLSVPTPAPRRVALVLGVITGIGIATKVTALSLCAIPLVLLSGWRSRRTWAYGLMVALLLSVAPIFPELSRLLRFVLQVATGTGLYGRNLFADKVDYWMRLKQLVREEIGFLAVVLAGAAVGAGLAWRARRRGMAEPRTATLKALLASVAVAMLQFALVLKQPYQPRYLLPALGLVGVMLALTLRLVCWNQAGRARPLVCALVIAVLTAAGVFQGRRLEKQVTSLTAAASAQEEARRLAESFTDCPVVNYYRSSSEAEALRHGNVESGLGLAQKLQTVHPDAIFLNGWSRQFQDYRGPLGADDWGQRWPCLVFQGPPGGPSRPFSPLSEFDRKVVPVTGALTVALEGPWEAVLVAGKSRRPIPLTAFSGWTHASGLGSLEGPYPDWGLPVVRWGLDRQTRLGFQGSGARMTLVAEGRPHMPAQVLVVLVNGQEAARHVYSGRGGFESLKVTFDSQPGPNEVVLEYGAAEVVEGRPLAVLFKTLRISTALVDSP